jgi:hypothetical protein
MSILSSWFLWLPLVALALRQLSKTDRVSFDAGTLLEVASIVLVLLWIITGVVAGINRLGFEAEQLAAREIRTSVERLGCTASEDVIGSAVQWNRTVATTKAWNRRWIADPLIPDGWDTVSVVNVPRCER